MGLAVFRELREKRESNGEDAFLRGLAVTLAAHHAGPLHEPQNIETLTERMREIHAAGQNLAEHLASALSPTRTSLILPSFNEALSQNISWLEALTKTPLRIFAVSVLLTHP